MEPESAVVVLLMRVTATADLLPYQVELFMLMVANLHLESVVDLKEMADQSLFPVEQYMHSVVTILEAWKEVPVLEEVQAETAEPSQSRRLEKLHLLSMLLEENTTSKAILMESVVVAEHQHLALQST